MEKGGFEPENIFSYKYDTATPAESLSRTLKRRQRESSTHERWREGAYHPTRSMKGASISHGEEDNLSLRVLPDVQGEDL